MQVPASKTGQGGERQARAQAPAVRSRQGAAGTPESIQFIFILQTPRLLVLIIVMWQHYLRSSNSTTPGSYYSLNYMWQHSL